jgi:cytochrome c-type protein NapB
MMRTVLALAMLLGGGFLLSCDPAGDGGKPVAPKPEAETPEPPKAEPPKPAVPEPLSDARKARAKTRAFYGAPPVIPHDVDDETNAACMECHYEEQDDGSLLSMSVPHDRFTNCRQCHVTQEPALPKSVAVSLETSWKGLAEPGTGSRAHAEAPPVIPHKLFLRERCLACHGEEGLTEGVATEHPERSNCRQCHVAEAAGEMIAP